VKDLRLPLFWLVYLSFSRGNLMFFAA